MTSEVQTAYDANAELYASLFLNDLDQDAQSLSALAIFAGLALQQVGPVVDVGCGPGSVVQHLHSLGLTALGYDLSPGQIAEARKAHPDHTFAVADLTQLPHGPGSLGGIVSRYSIIHLDPTALHDVFRQWHQALEPQAPLLVSFFGSRSSSNHGQPFDHKVVTAYELWPPAIGEELAASGFADVEITATPLPEGGRPFDHTTILARTPGS